MAFDFPAAPVQDQEFTPPGGPTYVFKDPTWVVKTSQVPSDTYVKKAGDTMTGNLTLAGAIPTVELQNTAASVIYGSKNLSKRWAIQLPTGNAESSGNAGSDFALDRYGDNGVLINSVMAIKRSDGAMTYRGDLDIVKANPVLRIDTSTLTDSPRLLGRKTAKNRWAIDLGTNSAESGSEAGSDFWITRYNDAGVAIDVPFQIRRNDGSVYIGGLLAIGNSLQFPATQVPSAGANNLDDYEEGTWVPTLRFGGASTGITYSTQSGRYVKIGRTVMVFLEINLTSKGTAVGVADIAGLPFAVTDVAVAVGAGWWANLASMTGHLGSYVAGTVFSPTLGGGAATVSGMTDLNFTATTALKLSATYLTS